MSLSVILDARYSSYLRRVQVSCTTAGQPPCGKHGHRLGRLEEEYTSLQSTVTVSRRRLRVILIERFVHAFQRLSFQCHAAPARVTMNEYASQSKV